MNIDLTAFWINQPNTTSFNNFTINSDKVCSLNGWYVGQGKVYKWNQEIKKYQLYCVVIDDTIFIDFSSNPTIKDVILQQIWILKHTTGIEYKIKYICLWEMFKLPTVEQLNEFAKIKVEQPTIEEEIDHPF